MDVQKLFRSLDFCVRVLKSSGLIAKNKYLRIFWIIVHLICFNGFLPGTIFNLNIKVDEMWKTAEKLHLIIGLIGMNIKLSKMLSGIEKIKNMREQSEKIFEKLCCVGEKCVDETSEPIKHELRFVERVFKLYFASTLFPLLSSTIFIPIFRKLPYKVFYPFDLKNLEWLQIAVLHQVYCHVFGCMSLMCISFLSVIFISYSIGFLSAIHKQLYYKVGQGREKVFIDCMESYKMVKKLVDDVKEHFAFILLFQSILGFIRIGILIFIIFETTEASSRSVAICLCFPLILEFFIPCHFGQDLTNFEICNRWILIPKMDRLE